MNSIPEASLVAIIDDEMEVANMIAAMLQSLGFSTTVHLSAAGFLQARHVENYAAIVLDLSLPEVDGLELLKQLAREEYLEPLIIITGLQKSVLHAALHIAQDLGFDVLGTLSKPFRTAELAHVMEIPLTAPYRMACAEFNPTEKDLHRALEQNELRAYVQPQVRFDTATLVGMEVLVRWQHPQHGLVMPHSFIALAESAGLALSITEFMTKQALLIAQHARRSFGFDGTISVNLAAVSLMDPDFPNVMEKLVNSIHLPSHRICFEVTETSVELDTPLALEILTRLAIKGFKIAIDDFGTGHSNLERLDHYPISEIKIDMGFVRRALENDRARVIVEESIVLGHKLGMQVVAEGVESLEHWNWLAGQGCDVAQGYYLSRPIPGGHVDNWSGKWGQSQPASKRGAG